jgi:ribosomal protein S18 acetylase RimI-like enzyme
MHEGMMKIIVVGKDEIDIIKPLWEGLNAHHLSKSTHFKKHFSEFTFEKRMEGLNKRDRLIAYVAQDNNENVGYCIATVDGLNGEVDSLFVEAAYRGRGVGEELMSLALKWLKEQKCETVRVSIAEGNESVHDFYRKFGFAERLNVMQLKQ